MITTELLSDADPAARPTLETAAALGIPFFKPGYYRYAFVDARKERDAAAAKIAQPRRAERAHRRAPRVPQPLRYIGGPVWDIARVIDSSIPKWAGYYFDVRHAVVEGGDGGWRTAFNLAAPRLTMIALKDFFWEKTATGWRIRNCPMGEGMVDWKAFFAMLAKAGFHGPVSLHLEYEVPGATPEAPKRTRSPRRRETWRSSRRAWPRPTCQRRSPAATSWVPSPLTAAVGASA